MSGKKNKLLSVILLILSQNLFSDTLLLPTKNVSSEIYLQQCQKSGYICSHKYILDKLKSVEPVKFNEFIENLNLISDVERKKIADDIQFILKTEMISTDQLNMLIQITEKFLTLEQNKKIEFLRAEMLQAFKVLEPLSESEIESEPQMITYVLFKKNISAKKFLKIKTQIQNFKFYTLDIYSLGEKTNARTDFLSGDCTHYQIASVVSEFLAEQQVLPVFENECSFISAVNKSMAQTHSFIVDYKKPLILTALAIGALFFLKNYDVEFR